MRYLIRLLYPLFWRYPKTRDLPLLRRLSGAEDSDAALWRRIEDRKVRSLAKIQTIGPYSPALKRLGRTVKLFLEAKGKTGIRVAVGLGENPRFESLFRKRLVLGSLSRLEALHETAHALFGRSEAVATGWSQAMWLKLHPKAGDRAKWQGQKLLNEKDFGP